MVSINKKNDPAIVASNVYKTIFGNNKVRVLDLLFKPGDKAIPHAHPDHVVYALTNSKIRITSEDGKASDIELKSGQVIFLEAQSHSAENIGKTDSHNRVIELKK